MGRRTKIRDTDIPESVPKRYSEPARRPQSLQERSREQPIIAIMGQRFDRGDAAYAYTDGKYPVYCQRIYANGQPAEKAWRCENRSELADVMRRSDHVIIRRVEVPRGPAHKPTPVQVSPHIRQSYFG